MRACWNMTVDFTIASEKKKPRARHRRRHEMAKTYQERATRKIKIILSIIANLEVVFGRNNFTAAEFTDTFSKMNGGDIWIDGCASVKEFLESLVALGDLDTTVMPSNSVIYFLPSKIAQPGHCGKGMK